MLTRGLKVFIAVALAIFLIAGVAVASPAHKSGKAGKAHKSATKSKGATKKAKAKFMTITGTVVLELTQDSTITTSTAANVHLKLMVKKGSKLKTVKAAKSNKKGEFRFKNIKPGSYTINAWAKSAGIKYSGSADVTATEGGVVVTVPPITIKKAQ